MYKRGFTVILKQKAKKNQIWRYQYCATARPQLFPEAVLKIIVFSKGFFFPNKLYQKMYTERPSLFKKIFFLVQYSHLFSLMLGSIKLEYFSFFFESIPKPSPAEVAR